MLTGSFLLRGYSSVTYCVTSSSSELICFSKLAWATLDVLTERWGVDQETKSERTGLGIQDMDSLHVLQETLLQYSVDSIEWIVFYPLTFLFLFLISTIDSFFIDF